MLNCPVNKVVAASEAKFYNQDNDQIAEGFVLCIDEPSLGTPDCVFVVADDGYMQTAVTDPVIGVAAWVRLLETETHLGLNETDFPDHWHCGDYNGVGFVKKDSSIIGISYV